MTTPTSTPMRPASPADHTHPCARCGAAVPLDVGLCERCNPLGLKDSASSQVHGTVFVAVGMAIVGLALIAHFAVAGIGPFTAAVVDVAAAGDGLNVSLQVTNEGTSPGTTTCRISDPALNGGGQRAFVMSPRIEPKATVTFGQTITGFGAQPRPLAVECSAP
jgi:hypothetical protein